MSNTKGQPHNYGAAGIWNDKPESWHQFMPTVKRRILMNTLGATMAFYKLEPGSLIPLHSHPQAQYGVCLYGAGVFKIGEKTWDLGKDDSYYVPPSMPHQLQIGDKETLLVEFFTPMRDDFLKDTVPADKY